MITILLKFFWGYNCHDDARKFDFKNTTFWKPAVLLSSGEGAPNLVDLSDLAILSH